MTTDKVIRIRRAPRDSSNPYFFHRRDTAQDRQLSYEARGMLGDLLSRPDDWQVQPKALEMDGCGRDKVYRILKELINTGYIHRDWITEKGVIKGIEYIVFEEPFTEKPDTAQPDTENPDNTYKRIKQKKENNILAGASPSDPTDPPVISTRFTKSRWYAFNPTTLRFGVKNYTAAEAKSKAPELEKYGFVMTKGSDLNARKDAEQLIGVVATNGVTSMFSVFAKYGFGIQLGQSVPDQIGSRVGELLNAFAELMMRTRNEVEKDTELITRVKQCYEDHKTIRPGFSMPNHAASFIPWWNEWVESHENKPTKPLVQHSVTDGLKF